MVRLGLNDPRVLEVIVVDDGSVDGTPDTAAAAGAIVMLSSLLGKGASMQDGVRAARGDVILFLDGDLTEIAGDAVATMVTPILAGNADLVKARFSRDAGRVTVLTAKPLLNSFFPELARFDQPLGGIVAARKGLLDDIYLETDYGVDVGLLIDAAMRGARLVEVDIGHIDHDSQPLEALGAMATQITRVIFDRAWRHERFHINQIREMQELERRARAMLLHQSNTQHASPKYALLDMDGVLLDGRFIVSLAEKQGLAADLHRFLDNPALREDQRTELIASLLTGLSADTFLEIAHAMPLMEGARETVVALKKAGYRVGVVTDSFHIAADVVRRRVFADFTVAHVLHFRQGRCTGHVTLSPMMSHQGGCSDHVWCKSNVLAHLSDSFALDRHRVLAVGDGDGDICLLRHAGVSVAFRPRSHAVENAADHTVWGPLTDVLAVVGLPVTDGQVAQPVRVGTEELQFAG
jgi:phosphoserine phosphatase